MIFGKRGKVAAGQAAAAQAMQQHVPQQPASPQQALEQLRAFPAELWDDGPVGKLLRDLGMSPDDEANLVPTGASIDARVARDRAKHEAKLAEINRDVAQRTGGGRVLPFFLIPEPCWNGDMGTFFMARLRFYPFDDWNVVFMPADERTAKIMNMPVCPGAGGRLQDDVVRLVQQLIQEAETKLAAVHAEVDRTRNFAALGEAWIRSAPTCGGLRPISPTTSAPGGSRRNPGSRNGAGAARMSRGDLRGRHLPR